MNIVMEAPILPGQTWVDRRGKHAGRRVEILKSNPMTVMVKYLRGNGRSWDGKDVGKVITLGANAFRQNFELVHKSGGGSVHDAPLPPAALRGEIRREEMAIAIRKVDEKVTKESEAIDAFFDAANKPEPMVAPVPTKVCGHCKQIKPLGSFHRYTKGKDGHQSWCKVCIGEMERTRRPERLVQMQKRRTQVAFNALTGDQKDEMVALFRGGESKSQIARAYKVTEAVCDMAIEEKLKAMRNAIGAVPAKAPETVSVTSVSVPGTVLTGTAAVSLETLEVRKWQEMDEADLRDLRQFTITYTVMRPVEVTETISAANMIEAIHTTIDGRDDVREVKRVEVLA